MLRPNELYLYFVPDVLCSFSNENYEKSFMPPAILKLKESNPLKNFPVKELISCYLESLDKK